MKLLDVTYHVSISIVPLPLKLLFPSSIYDYLVYYEQAVGCPGLCEHDCTLSQENRFVNEIHFHPSKIVDA